MDYKTRRFNAIFTKLCIDLHPQLTGSSLSFKIQPLFLGLPTHIFSMGFSIIIMVVFVLLWIRAARLPNINFIDLIARIMLGECYKSRNFSLWNFYNFFTSKKFDHRCNSYFFSRLRKIDGRISTKYRGCYVPDMTVRWKQTWYYDRIMIEEGSKYTNVTEMSVRSRVMRGQTMNSTSFPLYFKHESPWEHKI